MGIGKALKKIGKKIKKFVKKVAKKTGLAKLFKEVGRGIKKLVVKFGKFMDKIGVVGQIAVTLMLPAIGGALLKTAGTAVNALAKSSNILARAVGKVGQYAVKAVTKTGNVFRNLTKGVGETIKGFSQTLGNKIASTLPDGALKNFFANSGPQNFFAGKDSAFAKSFGEAGRLNYKNLALSEESLAKKIASVNLDIAKEAAVDTVTGTMDMSALETNLAEAQRRGDIVSFNPDGTVASKTNVLDITDANGDAIFKRNLDPDLANLDINAGLAKKGDVIVTDSFGSEYFADASAFKDISTLQYQDVTGTISGAFNPADVGQVVGFNDMDSLTTALNLKPEVQGGFFSRLNPLKDTSFDPDGSMSAGQPMTVLDKLKAAPAQMAGKTIDAATELPAQAGTQFVKTAAKEAAMKEVIGDGYGQTVQNVTYEAGGPSPFVGTGGGGASYASMQQVDPTAYMTSAGAYGYPAQRYTDDSMAIYNNFRQSIGAV